MSFRDLGAVVRESGIENHVDTVLISNNSLNAYALRHYLESPADRCGMRIERLAGQPHAAELHLVRPRPSAGDRAPE